MEAIIIFILKTTWYSLPICVANMMPVVFSKWFNFLAFPLDFNKKISGQVIFGNHKTFRGFLFAVIGGTLIFIVQKYAFLNSDFFHRLSIIDYSKTTVWLGFLMGLGAVLGDLIKSFIKRRMSREPGTSWFPIDQIDYILGGMLLGFILYIPPLEIFLFALVLGILLHIATNGVGKAIGIRKTAW